HSTDYLGDFSDEEAVVNAGETAFDFYTGQVNSTLVEVHGIQVSMENTEHTDFHPRLAQFFLKELLSGYPISNPYTGTYNFGETTVTSGFGTNFAFPRTQDIIDQSLSISNGDELWVNRTGEIGAQGQGNPMNQTGKPYELFIRRNACDQTPVTVACTNSSLFSVGDASVGNTASVYIEDQATLAVQKNSTLTVDDNSTVYVQAGGTLEILQNGKVEVLNGGKIVVESGGTFKIGNAVINVADFASTIHIESGGTLQILDPFTFPGNGYFQFDMGNILDVQMAEFALLGQGNTTRFIKLNSGADLILPTGKNLSLSHGKIDFGFNTSISVSSGAVELNFLQLVGMQPSTGTGIYIEQGTGLAVTGCQFNNLAQGLHLDGYIGANPISLDYCTFSEFSYRGLVINDCTVDLEVNHCDFSWPQAATAIELGDVFYSRIYNTTIHCTNQAIGAIGMRLKSSKVTVLDDSEISNCDIGIDGRQQTGLGQIYYNNIDLINQTTIEDCNIGVYLEGA
ncbi:MAG: NosD domain-containing protein, partial [Bacteroidota bacterium]